MHKVESEGGGGVRERRGKEEYQGVREHIPSEAARADLQKRVSVSDSMVARNNIPVLCRKVLIVTP